MFFLFLIVMGGHVKYAAKEHQKIKRARTRQMLQKLTIFYQCRKEEVTCIAMFNALAGLVKDSRRRTLEIRKVNGTAIGKDHELVSHLERVGFIASYRGWVLRD
jgi:hypothetical protein